MHVKEVVAGCVSLSLEFCGWSMLVYKFSLGSSVSGIESDFFLSINLWTYRT